MYRAFLVVAIVFAGVVIVLIAKPQVQFEDLEIDQKLQELKVLANRNTVYLASSGHDDVASKIGIILVVDEENSAQHNTFDLKNTIRIYRPPTEDLAIEIINRVLYEGNVSRSIGAGGKYTGFLSKIEDNKVAELIIKDEIRIGYRYANKIPYVELEQIMIPLGKTYYFIESVTLTSAQYKIFEKIQSKSAINGKAFAINGDIYSSRAGSSYKYEPFVSVDVFDISLLQTHEGADESQLNRLYERVNTLTIEEYEQLRRLLIEKSKTGANRSIKDAKLSLLRYNINFGQQIKPLKQEMENGCWATVATMLRGWKDIYPVVVEDVLRDAGSLFENRYRDDSGLRSEEKNRFLQLMGLTFQWGQSYAVEGLEDLLMRYGPLWFTVDMNINTHAIVVTGLIGTGKMADTYVLYIDPKDGLEKKMRYGEFMRWYERAALSTQIQVVHYDIHDAWLSQNRTNPSKSNGSR